MSAKPETAPYRVAFDRHHPAGFSERRDAALARFETLGFPTRRDEAWRFTDLKKLQRNVFAPAEAAIHAVPDLAAWRFPGAAHRIVLVNGRFATELSEIGDLPAGVSFSNLAAHPRLAEQTFDASETDGAQPFAALNAALFADGFLLMVAPGVKLEAPVEIIHWGVAPDRSFHTRNLVTLGEGAAATLIETYAGRGSYWTNAVTTVRLGARAALRHAKLQDESLAAVHLAQIRATLATDSRYDSFVLTLGGNLSRHDSIITYDGEGAACGLFGAYLLRGEQEATNATFVDHAVPSCTTTEVFKGVVDERAHGVFLGRIAVRADAQKTNAHQLNKNLLLSSRAAVDTKPELEILADDVKCSHGATVGDLDEEALFYLEARGIPAPEARRMLIEAFAADAIDKIEDDAALRAHLTTQVQRWLGQESRS
jgi:Fe-S cluster assembly protein SufD